MYNRRYVHTDREILMKQRSDGADAVLGYNGALVMQAMVQGHAYGFDIMRAAHLPSGTVYPLLRRLEAGGLVRSRWEDPERARAEGRPSRRYYEVTAPGRAALAEARERLMAQQVLFGDAPGKGA
jgi:DNA-binding PadR family transcriptional regulator